MNSTRRAEHEAIVSLAHLLSRRAAAARAELTKRLNGLLSETPGDGGSWPLDRDVRAPSRARRLVREQLARWELNELADTTELLVSELVTNALAHGCGPIRLCMSLSCQNRTLRCAIVDACPALPRLSLTQQDEEHGRGLFLLDRLAARWGSRRTAVGKTVWFEVRTSISTSPPAHAGGKREADRGQRTSLDRLSRIMERIVASCMSRSST
ncbi:ATP-binding protein [Streptomyces lydicamycinicus]|uniref:ATP-binding protein n=1 Tax=Streptomyces lydicamycinicus TaxID=1546107 RepID=UPI002035E6FB|nr:ATP-binding protein [Streptomyces lydicamycinicus]USA00531.1 ATP-binding protein [Streptomyces lydicamycinicus]